MKKKIFGTLITIVCALSLSANAYAAPDLSTNKVPTTSGSLQLEQGYRLLTPEQQAASDEKSKLADEYVASKKAKAVSENSSSNLISPLSAGGSKTNLVGHFKQTYNNTCGPVSAKNCISGYTQKNGGNSPSETTLATALNVNPGVGAGAAFDATIWQPTLNSYAPGNNYTLTWGTSSGWNTSLANKVIFTIDKAANYDVIFDLYHGAISNPVRPEYASGAAHYICCYGYNDVSKLYYISDSYSAVPQTYNCSYQSAADSTQQRGCIW